MWRRGWYFQIVLNEYQHWTFPKHNYKRVVTLSVLILDNTKREMISQEIFSCIILCHSIYRKVVLRPERFGSDCMWNSKVKFRVWVCLVKRADLSVSTSQWSGDRPTCLCACVITGSPEGGTHYSISHTKHLCACTRLRQMSHWQGRGTN